MGETVYVNGAYVAREAAVISVFDRGFLFADGIYEVCAVLDGRLIDNAAHLDRLERCVAAIDLALPISRPAIVAVQKELVVRNALREGLVYMQVTRGAADRDFAFPSGASPTLVAFVQKKQILGAAAADTGVSVITVPDIRWARRDIKSVALLAQVLAKQQARTAGCAEAFMVEDGLVTEGASSSAFIVTQDGAIVTRPLSRALLPGCTRKAVLRLAQERAMKIEERAFSVDEAYAATECFFTSASAFVMPVVAIDGRKVGSGKPGAATRRLRDIYIETARATAE